MAITNLAGTKWLLTHGNAYANDFPNEYLSTNIYNGEDSTEQIGEFRRIRVIANEISFVGSTPLNWRNTYNLWKHNIADAKYYKTIIVEIVGGSAGMVPETIAWFETNATQIVDPPTDWLYKFLSDSGLLRVFQKLKAVLDKKAALDVSSISTAGGGTEVHATISQSNDEASFNYYKQGLELPDYVNLSVNGDGFSLPTRNFVDNKVPFVATYEQATYADVTAAIDADRSIVVNFPANRNLICVTYSTYVQGQNVLMYGIFKYQTWVSLATITLTPANEWRVTHTKLQELLESGINIKTVNNQSLLGSGNIDVGGGGTVDTAMSDTSENAVQNKVIKSYVDGKTGDLSVLTTDNKTNLVSAINEVYEKSGEPFRVKNWAASGLSVSIPYCTEDLANTSIAKMTYSIDAVEGASYQIVGMISYEVFDSNGQRINCWPVCQFTGNGQKELSVRWACMGSSRKTATKVNAWVLLKHR